MSYSLMTTPWDFHDQQDTLQGHQIHFQRRAKDYWTQLATAVDYLKDRQTSQIVLGVSLEASCMRSMVHWIIWR